MVVFAPQSSSIGELVPFAGKKVHELELSPNDCSRSLEPNAFDREKPSRTRALAEAEFPASTFLRPNRSDSKPLPVPHSLYNLSLRDTTHLFVLR